MHKLGLAAATASVLLVATTASPLLAEVVGPFSVLAAPTSARYLGGTIEPAPTDKYFAFWMNVQNTYTSVDAAFSGLPVVNDGYANLFKGMAFDLDFAAGQAFNGAGADLVLFDARFDAGAYAVSTSFDNFAATLTVGINDFIDTGESRVYWVEPGEGGTQATQHTGRVFGAPIDLSSLGVPPGVDLSTVRFRALDFGADPLGIGSLVPEPSSALMLAPAVLLLTRWRRG